MFFFFLLTYAATVFSAKVWLIIVVGNYDDDELYDSTDKTGWLFIFIKLTFAVFIKVTQTVNSEFVNIFLTH